MTFTKSDKKSGVPAELGPASPFFGVERKMLLGFFVEDNSSGRHPHTHPSTQDPIR